MIYKSFKHTIELPEQEPINPSSEFRVTDKDADILKNVEDVISS